MGSAAWHGLLSVVSGGPSRAARVLLAALFVVACFALPSHAGAAGPGPVLAVAAFDNHSADPAFDPLGRGLADMLITDLGAVASLTVVERGRLQAVQDELALQQSIWADPSTAAQVGKGVGASLIVVGSITSIEPTVRLDARVLDVATAQVRGVATATGTKADFFLLEKELAQGLLTALDLAATARERAQLGRVATESFDALLRYSQALEALDRGRIDEAKAKIEAALEADDRFDRAANVLTELGKRLAELDRKRATAQDERLSALLARIDALEKSGGPYDPLQTEVMAAMSAAATPKEARVAALLTGRLLDLKLPEALRIGGPTGHMSLTEWALCTHAMSLHWLGRWSEFLANGEACLERYPTGTYGPAIQPMMQRVVAELDKARSGRAQVPAARAEAMLEMWKTRCRGELRPRERLASCERWIHSLGNTLDDDANEAYGRAAGRAGELGALERRLAETLRIDRYAESAQDLQREVSDLKRDLERADEARKTWRSAKTPREMAEAADRIAEVGDEEGAKTVLAEALRTFPFDNDVHRARLNLALEFGRWDDAARALAAWEGAEAGGAKVDASLARAVREAKENNRWVDESEGTALVLFAHKLRDLALYRDAGDTYLDVARRFPTLQISSAAASTQMAAYAYYTGGLADAARGAFETLLTQWPDAPEATGARSMMDLLPR